MDEKQHGSVCSVRAVWREPHPGVLPLRTRSTTHSFTVCSTFLQLDWNDHPPYISIFRQSSVLGLGQCPRQHFFFKSARSSPATRRSPRAVLSGPQRHQSRVSGILCPVRCPNRVELIFVSEFDMIIVVAFIHRVHIGGSAIGVFLFFILNQGILPCVYWFFSCECY
jgi:hypothetical protein